METLETEKPLLKPISEHTLDMTRHHGKNAVVSILLQPFQWLQMLSSRLNPSFVVGVVLVYGLNQGFSGSIFKVVTDYYWKDVQQVEPSVVQLYMGLYYIPWVMRPIWGLFTDVFPIRGYKRKPYFVVAGVLGVVSAVALVVFGKVPAALALSCLLGVSAAMAIAEVVIDACIATNSINIRSLAPDIQSLCMVCSSAGALVGYATSGVFVHRLGPQGALGVLALPPATIIILGIFFYEKRSSTVLIQKNKKEADGLGVAVKGMYKTIKYPQVWKPSLYMFISLALNISTHEGYFYWYTDPKAGPAFSQEFVGIIYAIGALASMFGVLIYHKKLKGYSFRNTLFFAQLLYALSGTLDLVFIKRWNILLGIPDSFFVVTEESFSRIISKIRWIPMVVLSTRLCPLGIEGTFFAFLMCIDSFGQLASKWSGGFVLHAFGVTRHEFGNLWLVILLRNVMRFATLCFVFLVPDSDHLDDLVPSEMLPKNQSEDADDDIKLLLL
ncbi:probable folate-biopterin transporter 6 [Brassica napus]|uniref:probable folate-biopterin transporter 6 n=1 Tax=Brassica napus TaxID=3708 RepID=UPI0006AB7492|nr:probable folate-biopterin transporter 6 [Brassica napus]XP_013678919.1 probable folate-biopterin transporter 6 [Brassica napus]XP_022554263.1 probable folate-biopterin transporter 6 [Brassica napus]XP_048602738.1 probable folate-biopterin transporter 6 [Brassica napus]XP_048602739.1 probable folate-biopterin transporter 6 [Brassica napus]XP_048602740.1 probable folate-biopterin transporter 6 [Brassica napus]XP_048602743.1 probable folate-biopterin transporter 6 [Brassica napus]XP_04860274